METKKTDLTKLSDKNFVSLMRNNDSVVQALANAKQFDKVVKAIEKLNVVYTDKQLQYFKNKLW